MFLALNMLPVAATELESYSLINGCMVYDMKGNIIRSFPGQFCIFLDDGSFISADQTGIRKIAKDNSIKWELKESIHHQIKLSPDGARILGLSSSFSIRQERRIRLDKFLIISLDGNILHEQTSEVLAQHIDLKEPFSPSELTHFNSIYEVPVLNKGNPYPSYLAPGNVVVNSYRIGVFILSPDMQKVLHHRVFNNSRQHRVHDVQILENGNFLYFNNTHNDSPPLLDFSSVVEMSPRNQVVFEFTANPKSAFFSLHCGGVQKLQGDHLVVSHMVSGTYLISIKDKSIKKNIWSTHYQDFRFMPSQDVKAHRLENFLSHWKF
jgi:hypothetical protein